MTSKPFLLLLVAAVSAASLTGCAIPDNRIVEPTIARPHLSLDWRIQLVEAEYFDTHPLEYSTPVVSDGVIYLGTSSGDLVAVDLLSGKRLWAAETGARVDARPVLLKDGSIIVGNDAGNVNLIESGGHIRWTYAVASEVDGAVTAGESLVYFLDSKETLHAVDIKTGKRAWTHKRDVPDYFTLRGAPEPLLHDGVLYAGFADGFAIAFTASTGEIIWGKDLGAGEDRLTDVDRVPVWDAGKLYLSSYSGGVYCLDAVTGKTIWRHELHGASEIALAGDTLYVTSASRHVRALDKATGKPRWKLRHPESVPTKPVVAGGYLAYGSTEQGVYMLDRETGYPMMHFDPDEGFNAPVVFDGDTVLMFSNAGYLYRFRLGLL